MDRRSTVVIRIEPGEGSAPSRRDELARQLMNDLEERPEIHVSVPEVHAPARAKGLDAPQIETLVISFASSAAVVKEFSKVLIAWIERTATRSVEVDGTLIKGYGSRAATALLETALKSHERGA